MVNELNNTISEAIGKLEKTVAIIEYLKFSIQDGMVNISDEAQKKQVLEALDKFTDIQKSNFKFIQAIEMLGSDMKLNLNALYPILPADVLRTVLGEQNNYEDLPEDLVSKIMGDESNNLNNSSVDDSIQEVSDEKNDLMSQIMELAPKTESEVVTTLTEETPEVTSEVATPPVEATPEVTSEAATPSVEATPEATSEVKTPPVEATPEVTSEATSEVVTPPADVSTETTSEVVTPSADVSTDTTSEVVTPPVDVSTETTSEVVTPPVDVSTETTSEVVTPPEDVSAEITGEVVTPPVDVSTETTSEVVIPPVDVSAETTGEVVTPPADVSSELDSIVLPSLDDTSSEISTYNNTVESISSTNSEDTALLHLSDEKSTEKTEDSSVLLPLELDNSEDNKTNSEDSNVILSLDSSNTVKEKNEDSMVAGSELVLPVLQQSLDVAEDSKNEIVSLDTSPVSDSFTFVSRGNPKLLAVTSKQFSNLNSSLVTQMSNPEISRVLNFSTQDSRLDNTESLESAKGNDLEMMLQEMEKAYSEGRVAEAERLSQKISEINSGHQKTLSLSNAA